MRVFVSIFTIGIASAIGGNAYSHTDSDDSCATLLANAVALKESSNDQGAYDAFRGYIESCAYLSTSCWNWMSIPKVDTTKFKIQTVHSWIQN
jgi:hypothetical protein